jgi:hypothetical protein
MEDGKLFACLLVIAVLLSWWWMWRVEGLIHLLVIVVILTSLIGKLGLIALISQWQSSLPSVNPINDCSNGAFHVLKSCADGLLVLHE